VELVEEYVLPHRPQALSGILLLEEPPGQSREALGRQGQPLAATVAQLVTDDRGVAASEAPLVLALDEGQLFSQRRGDLAVLALEAGLGELGVLFSERADGVEVGPGDAAAVVAGAPEHRRLSAALAASLRISSILSGTSEPGCVQYHRQGGRKPMTSLPSTPRQR
jgi:hypothetical protein